jgi:two-component system phosphate regulon response regulator OmpR
MVASGTNPAQEHIVVVDDEPHLRDLLARYLCKHGFDALALDGGPALRAHLQTRMPSLVVLDLNMPGEHGLDLARFLHRQSSAAVLILTGEGDPIDRIVGLEVGADDYVVKPVDPRELVARVRAILRRGRPVPVASPAQPVPAAAAAARGVRMGRCLFDPDAPQLLGVDGRPMPLTGKEIELLRVFALRPNRVLTRDQLLELTGDTDGDAFDRSIDVRIARLRKKLEPDPDRPQSIRTVRGMGYSFVPEEG